MTLDDRAKPAGIHHLLAQLAAAEDVIHIVGAEPEFCKLRDRIGCDRTFRKWRS